MNWEQLYKLLGEMIGDDGKVPPEMEEQVVIVTTEGEMSLDLVQSLGTGKLSLVPQIDETEG